MSRTTATTASVRPPAKAGVVRTPKVQDDYFFEEEGRLYEEVKTDATGSEPELKELKLLRSPEMSIASKRALLAELSGGNLTLAPSSKGARGQSQSYLLRIVTAGAVTPTAGAAASTFYCDPSNIPISEWSTFASVFDEVRLHSFSVTIAPYQTLVTQTAPMISSIAMGSFYSSTTLPSNIVNVLMAGDGELVSPLMVKPHKHTMKVPRLGFAPTSAPAGDTYRGCPGSIKLYATGVGSVSMLTYFVCGVYELRGRL